MRNLDGIPPSSGATQLRRHLAGKRLTQRQAILAKCCDCMGYYVDGRRDCRIPECSLHPLMPYRETASPRSAEGSLVASDEGDPLRTPSGKGAGP